MSMNRPAEEEYDLMPWIVRISIGGVCLLVGLTWGSLVSGNRNAFRDAKAQLAEREKENANLNDRVETLEKALAALQNSATAEMPAQARSATQTVWNTAVVSVVIDGDTLQLESGDRVRLIGVDTPETVHPTKPVEAFGKEASTFTKQQLLGERIRLTYDPANAALAHRDKYGRLLAYVYRDSDGLDFNAELIRQGFAHAYTLYPFERLDEFRRYEVEARTAARGLWASNATSARGPPTLAQAELAEDEKTALPKKTHERHTSSYSPPSNSSSGTVHVRGYYRKDGTYVRPHTRRRPRTSARASSRQAAPQPRSSGRVHVRGYYRKDGTYVRPHTRSRPRR